MITAIKIIGNAIANITVMIVPSSLSGESSKIKTFFLFYVVEMID